MYFIYNWNSNKNLTENYNYKKYLTICTKGCVIPIRYA